MQKIRRYRDLTIMDFEEESLVFACDTSASIGDKPFDSIKVNPEITARYCLRVALMEILSINAEPVTIFNLIGNEDNPTGRSMLKGIQAELELAGYPEIIQNGSTEENMPTSMTSISVLAVGRVLNNIILANKASSGNVILQIGRRSVGEEVLEWENEIIQYDDLEELRSYNGVNEIVPVGSKGILAEAEILAKINGLALELSRDLIENAEMKKSAGPTTTVIVAVEEQETSKLLEKFKDRQARIIGRLV